VSSKAELNQLYNKGRKQKTLALFSFFFILIGLILVALSVGAGSPTLNEALNVIFARTFPFLNLNPGSDIVQLVILQIRLPRIVLAIIAGAGLAVSGATLQGVLRNPLVSSYTLGISAGACFGAALAIVFHVGAITSSPNFLTVANAFIFSLVAVLIVYGISRIRGVTAETAILAGLAISCLFSSLLSFIQYVAPDYEAVRSIVFWTLGSFMNTTWSSVLVVLPFTVITLILMFKQSWDLNVLSLGEDVAKTLGVNTKRTISLSLLLVALSTASIMSFTGIIGFICLMSPHIARIIIGSDHRFVLPCSALIGSCLLLGSDTIARIVLLPADLPIGIVTGLIGAPFFIYLLLTKRRRNWF
jgi:ABC-type Fe3+-siderophore transport system, permease component